MAVSKRTRFEVLRRDNHTCRYCGQSAPDVKLTVDHVLPVALGGHDDPTNLVAACKDFAYLATTLLCTPFSVLESACGRGASVMVHARPR